MSVESTNIVVTYPMGEECLRQISATSHNIKVWDVSDWVRAELNGDFTFKNQLDAVLAETEVMYGESPPINLTTRAPNLKWIQSIRAGINHFSDDILQSQVILTNFPYGTPVSEFAIHLMLMLAKEARLCFQRTQAKQWERFDTRLLHSKTVGILGVGHIGRRVARLAKAFGMRVLGIDAERARDRYVDVMLHVELPSERLRELLLESDFVVNALPLTRKTNKLIREAELRTMKSTAYLINVSRGAIVDQDALIRALEEHWIAGAGLDVFATEPLPTESRLWELPNVILSPHVAVRMEGTNEKVTQLFCENLRRYLDGKKLLNVVDKEKGY